VDVEEIIEKTYAELTVNGTIPEMRL